MRQFFRTRLRRLADRIFGDLARRGDIDNLYNQITAYIQIREMMAPSLLLNPLRGWAISPDALVYILADLEQRQAPTIVEFGSGESTIVLAAALARRKAGRLLTVEHDKGFIDQLMKRLATAQLASWVDIHHAPARGFSTVRSGDYELDLSGLPEVQLDLALIGGPPGIKDYGAPARRAPLEWALNHLKAGGTVFMDDAYRPAEQSILAKVMRDHAQMKYEMIYTEKGLAKATFGET